MSPSARELYRPTDPDQLAVELHRLAATGLTPNDLATALHLNLVWVREVLATDPSRPTP